VDTTVVETNIHHPTDSTVLGDGVRVLTRVKMKITVIAAGAKLRDPQLECAARTKGPVHQEKLKRGYRGLSNSTEPWWREGRAGDVREQGLGDRKPRQMIQFVSSQTARLGLYPGALLGHSFRSCSGMSHRRLTKAKNDG
jgi:hypothetical protein